MRFALFATILVFALLPLITWFYIMLHGGFHP